MAQSDWAKKHVDRYRASNGTDGHHWDELSAPGRYPCLLLTTTGRKSRMPRTSPLVYGRDGENYTLIASQDGRPAHPAWYLNLAVTPQVEVQVGADIFTATAHSTAGDERERLWNMMREVYPLFDDYQAKVATVREIPLVVLVPN